MPRDLDIAPPVDLDDDLPEAGLIALIHCIFFLIAGAMLAGAFEQEAHPMAAPQQAWQSPLVLPLVLPRCRPVQAALRQLSWQRPPTPVSSRPAPASCP